MMVFEACRQEAVMKEEEREEGLLTAQDGVKAPYYMAMTLRPCELGSYESCLVLFLESWSCAGAQHYTVTTTVTAAHGP